MPNWLSPFNVDAIIEAAPLFKTLVSLALILCVTVARRVLITRLLRSRKEERRNLTNTIKQISNGLLFLVLIMVWSSEVQNLAISVAAFMVAIVLATREFLQCLLGFFYYLFTRPFRVGDWIEINETTVGEVYAIDWLKVTLIEVDKESLEHTGKTAYVPNNWLVSRHLKNLNFMRRYAMHSFKLTIAADKSPLTKMHGIQKVISDYCETFHDVALRYKDKIERYMETEFITVEPQLNIRTNEFGLIELHVSLFCPTARAASLENCISRDILLLLQQGNEPVQLQSKLFQINTD